MALIDPQGKLFGKINVIDAVVVLAVVLAGVGFALTRLGSGTGRVLSQATAPVEVDMLIRSLSIGDPSIFAPDKKTAVVIRNQPAGELTIRRVKVLPHLVTLAIDGKPQSIPDPGDPYGRDYVITLGGTADVTADGLVLGRVKAKIGTPIEIEGYKYIVRGSIVDVRQLAAASGNGKP